MLLVIYLLLQTNIVAVRSILGGHDIDIEEAPYHLNYGDVCGGALIHKKWAITSAHCGTTLDYVRIGSRYRVAGTKVKVQEHIVHPEFGKEHEFDYDIQLLKLKGLRLNKKVSSIPISDGGDIGSISVAGWGYQREKGEYQENLQQVHLLLVPQERCQQMNQSWYNHLTDRMFCAGGGMYDACQGDSGSAAVWAGQLVGLSSFGYGCGRGYPGVYINISEPSIRSWIYNYTGI